MTPTENVTVNFVYMNHIIGELKIGVGKSHENKSIDFMKRLLEAKDIEKF